MGEAGSEGTGTRSGGGVSQRPHTVQVQQDGKTYKVVLTVGAQTFYLRSEDYPFEGAADAEWIAGMLKHALGVIYDAGQQQAFDGIGQSRFGQEH